MQDRVGCREWKTCESKNRDRLRHQNKKYYWRTFGSAAVCNTFKNNSSCTLLYWPGAGLAHRAVTNTL